MSTPSYFPFHSSRRFYIYIPFPRGRALKRVKSRHRRNIIIFDFLEIDSSAWRKKKNIALKGIETIIEGCVHVKEEERGRVLWDEQIMKRGANWEATIEPLKNDGRWLSSGAFVAAAKGEPFNAVSAPMQAETRWEFTSDNDAWRIRSMSSSNASRRYSWTGLLLSRVFNRFQSSVHVRYYSRLKYSTHRFEKFEKLEVISFINWNRAKSETKPWLFV